MLPKNKIEIIAEYTVGYAHFEIAKIPKKKRPVLRIRFDDAENSYTIADFKDDTMAQWACDVVDTLIEVINAQEVKTKNDGA